MLSSNRVARAIADIRGRLEVLEPEKRTALNETLALENGEHFRFQNLQAEAHAMQKLTTDEALIVYESLGELGDLENGGWASGTDLATKIVVTQLMGELLQWKKGLRVSAAS